MFKDLSNDLINTVQKTLAINEESSDYKQFFQSALDKFGVNSPAELSGDKEKEFYDYIDKEWKGEGEKAEATEEQPVEKTPVEEPVVSEEEQVTYPHTMYDPNSGESVEVADEEEHNIYKEMGWVSEPAAIEEQTPPEEKQDTVAQTDKVESYDYLSEPAVSQSQQKLMAMALAYKRGEMKASDASDQVKQLAKDMTEKELEDFASTPRKGLPEADAEIEDGMTEAPINDSTPINQLGGRNGLIRALKKDPKVAKYTKGLGLYFDDADLVMGSVTAVRDVITNDGMNAKMKLGDVKRAILSTKQELSAPQVPPEADKAKMIPEAIDPAVGKKIVPLLKIEFKKISDAKSGTDDNQYSNMVLQDVNSLQNVYMKLWNATKTNEYTEALDDYSDLDTAVRDEVPMRLEMLITDLMNQAMYESKKVLATEAVGDAFKELNTNVFQIQDRNVLSDVLRTADALARAIERDTQTSKGVVLKTLNGLMVKGKDIRSKEGEEIVDIKEFLPRDGKGGSIVAKLKSGKFITLSLR